MSRSFQELSGDLASDGALRDFYIEEATVEDWDRLLCALPQFSEALRFKWGDRVVPMPDRFSQIEEMQRSDATMLFVEVSGARVVCHFFGPDEIEFDFRPEDYRSEEKWTSLVQFFERIVRIVGKRGIITFENQKDAVIQEVK